MQQLHKKKKLVRVMVSFGLFHSLRIEWASVFVISPFPGFKELTEHTMGTTHDIKTVHVSEPQAGNGITVRSSIFDAEKQAYRS